MNNFALLFFLAFFISNDTEAKPSTERCPLAKSEITCGGPVVWTEPAFPTQIDDITVYFNAAEGNAALAGFSGDVYAHTGVISNFSANASDWQHVQGEWGTADAKVLMTKDADDLYSISYNIEDFYEISVGEMVNKLSFVFRNEAGDIVGREADGSDIFTDVFPVDAGLQLSLITPQSDEVLNEGENLPVEIQINQLADVVITDNSQQVYAQETDYIDFVITPSTLGLHEVIITADNGDEDISLTLRYFVVDANQSLLDPPANTQLGFNDTGGSFVFQLYAPEKEHAFLLCPDNDFTFDLEYLMNRSLDQSTFWIELPKSNFDNDRNVYQYLVDGNIVVADPFSEVVLDPNNDGSVAADVMAELPPYPAEATGRVTVFDFEPQNFDWQHSDFSPAQKTDLVIYELLMRDFLGDHSYVSLLDTLDYLQRLGVNAIELMPINEFENNNSWGYNPSFHMAVDKYYGSRTQLKQVIDAAHGKGIAVILDVVFNHAFSQSPLAQLYWDAGSFKPSSNSPYLNVEAKHPFNVGYDFNHESQATKTWVKQVLTHWINEFQFDGFRFDLSKGMTQTNSGSNAGLMAQYDASRIAILKDYADHIWSEDDDSYVIMEHFADNSEEKELAEYGMMLWSNSNFQFIEAAMGYDSNLDWIDYTQRGWNVPHGIGYMESHDEERMAYKIFQWGNSEGDYNTKSFNTAMHRIEAASAIFYSIPGPKMLWQFGELGYDYSINHCVNGTVSGDCRLDPKPIRWDYQEVFSRARLNEVLSNIIQLRTSYPTFSTTDFTFDDSDDFIKSVHLNHVDMNAVVLANYQVTAAQINPNFQSTGTWYDYISGDSLIVTATQAPLDFTPGEYRIYSSERITPPNGLYSSIPDDLSAAQELQAFPNPVAQGATLSFDLGGTNAIESIQLRSTAGQLVAIQQINQTSFALPNQLAAGVYFLLIKSGEQLYLDKIVVQ